jgi:hypothetical protein
MAYLKLGDWNIHASGTRGTLRIREIDDLGRVFGTMCDESIRGWWSERARRLTFVRERGHADASDEQGFKGYAWDEPTEVGAPRIYYLSGSYETFGGGDGAKDRQSFGWFATFATGRVLSGPTIESERGSS